MSNQIIAVPYMVFNYLALIHRRHVEGRRRRDEGEEKKDKCWRFDVRSQPEICDHRSECVKNSHCNHSPDVILCGWLGLKHQLTTTIIVIAEEVKVSYTVIQEGMKTVT